MSKVLYVNFNKEAKAEEAFNRQEVKVNIQPAIEEVSRQEVVTRKADPIKSLDEIDRICNYLIENKKYRDNMLFVCGINFGLRVSDLITLRFADLINSDYTFKKSFTLVEKKTEHTRKKVQGRTILINDAVINAVMLYLEHHNVHLSDYMFKREDKLTPKNQHITRATVDNILKRIKEDLNINIRMSSHTLRKTFGYHIMMAGDNDPRRLYILMKIFGHSSPVITLDYIGITQSEIEDIYLNLNLGKERQRHTSKYINTDIG